MPEGNLWTYGSSARGIEPSSDVNTYEKHIDNLGSSWVTGVVPRIYGVNESDDGR